MLRKIFLILFFSMCVFAGYSQDTLPRITVTQLGNKALISWTNLYTNVTGITIQRSGDSIRNFTSIGTVLNVGAVTNGFVDQKEFLPNEQYYRLFITFEGGSFIFTESQRPGPDTLRAEIVEIVETDVAKQIVAPPVIQRWFVPSRHVFTGKDNNIIISLPNAFNKKYSLKFFEDYHTFLFEIKRITEDRLVLDKVNFLHAGLFRFELYDDGKLIERHKVYIPKDGQNIPLLDADGYEVKGGKTNRR